MAIKYKLNALFVSTNVSNARALRCNYGPCCNLYSLYNVYCDPTLWIPKENSNIVRTNIICMFVKIVNIFIFYKMETSFNFCIQQSKIMYMNMPRPPNNLWSSKKKMTTRKVIANFVKQNEVLDMANFEINFLSNHN